MKMSCFSKMWSDSLFLWDGERWYHLFLGGFLLDLSLEDLLEKLLIFLGTSFVFIFLFISIAHASSNNKDGSDNWGTNHTTISSFSLFFSTSSFGSGISSILSSFCSGSGGIKISLLFICNILSGFINNSLSSSLISSSFISSGLSISSSGFSSSLFFWSSGSDSGGSNSLLSNFSSFSGSS